MQDSTSAADQPAHGDHAGQVISGHAHTLEAVLSGYIQILEALAVATRDEAAAMLHEAVTDLRAPRPTGHPIRHLLGWAKQRAQDTVNETTRAALLVISTDLTQQLGRLITTS